MPVKERSPHTQDLIEDSSSVPRVNLSATMSCQISQG